MADDQSKRINETEEHPSFTLEQISVPKEDEDAEEGNRAARPDVPSDAQADAGFPDASLEPEHTPFPPEKGTASPENQVPQLPVKKTKLRHAILLESEAGRFLFSGRQVQAVERLETNKGFLRFVADFPESPDMGIITVESQTKYAEVLARKRLEERGDLGSEHLLWVYEKKRSAKSSTRLLYQIFPRKRFEGVFESLSSNPAGFLLWDTVSLLLAQIRHSSKFRDRVLALHLPDSILVLAARGPQIHLIQRFHLLSRGRDSLQSALATIEQELEGLRREAGFRVPAIEWIEWLTEKPDVPVREHSIPLNPWPVSPFTQDDGRTLYSGVPEALAKAADRSALGPREERLIRPLERSEKWLAALLLLASVIFLAGGIIASRSSQTVSAQLGVTSQQVRQVQNQIDAIAPLAMSDNVESVAELAGELNRAREKPALSRLWNTMADAKPAFCRLDSLSIRFEPGHQLIQMDGVVELDIAPAQSVFTRYLDNLQELGYTVVDQSLSLDMPRNHFSITLQRPHQEDAP